MLLAAQPEWSQKRAAKVVAALTFGRRGIAEPQNIRLNWLFAARASTDRVVELAELLSPRRGAPPWTGWPYTPDPKASRTQRLGVGSTKHECRSGLDRAMFKARADRCKPGRLRIYHSHEWRADFRTLVDGQATASPRQRRARTPVPNDGPTPPRPRTFRH